MIYHCKYIPVFYNLQKFNLLKFVYYLRSITFENFKSLSAVSENILGQNIFQKLNNRRNFANESENHKSISRSLPNTYTLKMSKNSVQPSLRNCLDKNRGKNKNKEEN